jgi:serine/threonine protein kinase
MPVQHVLNAVQYAHGNLVIHRDLKPSNVIVGNGRRAMLLDFGIARGLRHLFRDISKASPSPLAATTVGIARKFISRHKAAVLAVTVAMATAIAITVATAAVALRCV